MLKYYRKIVPVFTYTYFTALMILSSVFSPVLIKKNIFPGIYIMMFFTFISCLIGIIIIAPSGPVPSNKKYTEALRKSRSTLGGAGGYYDMNCIIPVKRKSYAGYALAMIAAMMVIHYEQILLTMFSGNDNSSILSTVLLINHIVMVIAASAVFSNPGKNHIALSIIMLIIFYASMFLSVFDKLNTLPALPAPVIYLMTAATAVYFAVFAYRNVLHGEFARNGERIC